MGSKKFLHDKQQYSQSFADGTEETTPSSPIAVATACHPIQKKQHNRKKQHNQSFSKAGAKIEHLGDAAVVLTLRWRA